jgi:hypothetical protein
MASKPKSKRSVMLNINDMLKQVAKAKGRQPRQPMPPPQMPGTIPGGGAGASPASMMPQASPYAQ